MPPFPQFFGFWPYSWVIISHRRGISVIFSASFTVRTCLIQNPLTFYRVLRWLVYYFCFLSIDLLFFPWIASIVLKLRTKVICSCFCRTKINSWVLWSFMSIVYIDLFFHWVFSWVLMYCFPNLWWSSALPYTYSLIIFWVVTIIIFLLLISPKVAYWILPLVGFRGLLIFYYRTREVCCFSFIFQVNLISI